MKDNFIEHKNFLRIYTNNQKYRKEHRRHNRALKFQIVILAVVVCLAIFNYYLDSSFVTDLYLDQFNRIYALLVALLTAILIGLTPIDRYAKLNEQLFDYSPITYKQDFVSIIMYTFLLYMGGLVINIAYAIFFQYLDFYWVDLSMWVIHTFLLLNSLFFTTYCVDELADIVKFVRWIFLSYVNYLLAIESYNTYINIYRRHDYE